ncbi:hypothetical protein [Microcoleus sp.]
MIQKKGKFSIISGVLTIALCGGCGLFLFKKPVQSIPSLKSYQILSSSE